MTKTDKLGKAVSRALYANAKRDPGAPTMTSHANYALVDQFNAAWPWSWRK